MAKLLWTFSQGHQGPKNQKHAFNSSPSPGLEGQAASEVL